MPEEKEEVKKDENAEKPIVKVEKEKVEEKKAAKEKTGLDVEAWKPKTEIGRKVKAGDINDIDEILDKGEKILEPEIVDALLPDATTDLLLIGQSKGKFGGGQRRVFRQTQKKTKEGNKPQFATLAIVGDSNGHIGMGHGKSKETVPAREKAFAKAKLNIIKIRRGCGDWHCSCKEAHTIPFAVEGKCSSSIIKLMPAPKGTGLCVEKECAKVLSLAGIHDVWSKTVGKTTKMNLLYACFSALKQLTRTKVNPKYNDQLNLCEGSIAAKEPVAIEVSEEQEE